MPRAATYAESIEKVIRETAEEGDVVIVAHGASIPLAECPEVLRVLVAASPASRVTRLATVDAIDNAAAAKQSQNPTAHAHSTSSASTV